MHEIQFSTLRLLVGHALGDLTDVEQREAAALLEQSEEAVRVRRYVEHMLAGLRSGDLEDLPRPLMNRLQRAFAERKRRTSPSWLDSAAQVLLDLLVDTRERAVPTGYRGGGDGFVLAFSGASLDLDVEFAPPSDDLAETWTLLGCAETAHGTGAEIAAIARGQSTPAWTGSADATGHFSMDLAEGGYELLVSAGGRVYRTPPFEIP